MNLMSLKPLGGKSSVNATSAEWSLLLECTRLTFGYRVIDLQYGTPSAHPGRLSWPVRGMPLLRFPML